MAVYAAPFTVDPMPVVPRLKTCTRDDPACTGGCVAGGACTHRDPGPVEPAPSVVAEQPDPLGVEVTSGVVVRVGSKASVQFAGDREIRFRVIRIHDWPADIGWVWLDGYQLDGRGDALERRSIYVRAAGLVVSPAVAPARPARVGSSSSAPGRARAA